MLCEPSSWRECSPLSEIIEFINLFYQFRLAQIIKIWEEAERFVLCDSSWLLIMNNENQNTEYKRIWKDEYLKWVSGFANAQGRKIYIGIDDDMTVVGVNHLKRQLEDIPNKIISNTGVFPETNHLEIDGKDVIEIVIEPCGMRTELK